MQMTEKEQYEARLIWLKAMDAASEAGLARIHATLSRRAARAGGPRVGNGSDDRSACRLLSAAWRGDFEQGASARPYSNSSGGSSP